uniref:DnaJ (Hsp40) homolog, subfamily C, member 30b n=1 Tax=Oryzias latipes TaxID=8090 RepID=A0A3P9HC17_ORYLA
YFSVSECIRMEQNREIVLDAFKASQTRGHSSQSDEVLLHRSRTAYYDILRVSPSATQSQVKTAYYKQSFIYHPDKNPGNKEASQRFSEISEAYTVLGSISLRKKYDRGILSQSDIQTTRRFSQTSGKPMFDFDAFYQAHYGEQLQRERNLRHYKKHMEEMQEKRRIRWRDQKLMENRPITADLEISQQQVVDQKSNRDRRTDGKKKKKKRETQIKAPKMFQMCILRVEVVA